MKTYTLKRVGAGAGEAVFTCANLLGETAKVVDAEEFREFCVVQETQLDKFEAVLRKLVHEWDSWAAGDEPLGDERLEILVEEARTALGSAPSGGGKS